MSLPNVPRQTGPFAPRGPAAMIITTTTSIEGYRVTAYHGIVTGQTIMGANIFKDLFASIRDIVGGRAGAYEQVLRDARDEALKELETEAAARGANAIIGVDLDYGAVGSGESMMMVSASGTAVTVEPV
ncbi:MAG: hypothetical protein RLZZ437_867 [Pseudomonadota bacterium]